MIRVITKLPNSNNLPKGKSKLRSIKTDKTSQQPENCENGKYPDLVQAFPKKWWVESDFKAPNLPLSLWFNLVKFVTNGRQSSHSSDVVFENRIKQIHLTSNWNAIDITEIVISIQQTFNNLIPLVLGNIELR